MAIGKRVEDSAPFLFFGSRCPISHCSSEVILPSLVFGYVLIFLFFYYLCCDCSAHAFCEISLRYKMVDTITLIE